MRYPRGGAVWLLAVCLLWPLRSPAEDFAHELPLQARGNATYYASASLGSTEPADMLVDTGAAYVTINEARLEQLKAAGQVEYIRNMQGLLADGSRCEVPLYRLDVMTLGEGCILVDVEVAVMPQKSRMVLGMNALRQASPFIFETLPPRLRLSCGGKRPQIP